MKSDDAWAHLSTLCKTNRDLDALDVVREENHQFWRQAQKFAAMAKKRGKQKKAVQPSLEPA